MMKTYELIYEPLESKVVSTDKAESQKMIKSGLKKKEVLKNIKLIILEKYDGVMDFRVFKKVINHPQVDNLIKIGKLNSFEEIDNVNLSILKECSIESINDVLKVLRCFTIRITPTEVSIKDIL